MMRHKFATRRTERDGIKLQSQAEAWRYDQLKLLEQAGEIAEIKVHPRFKIEHNGIDICTVELDFAYIALREGGRVRYEDVKVERRKPALTKKLRKLTSKVVYTTDTRHSKIGRNLLKAFYNIDVDLIWRSRK